jgi:hypothetical protein
MSALTSWSMSQLAELPMFTPGAVRTTNAGGYWNIVALLVVGGWH